MSTLFVLGILLIAFSSAMSAQDLGSSNKLFGDKKNVSKSEKKPAAAVRTKKTKRSSDPISRRVRKPAADLKTPIRIAPRIPENTRIIPKAPLSPSENAEYLSLITRARSARKLFDFPAAESLFLQATELNPTDPVAFVSLGSLYASTMRSEKAEKAYRTALVLDSKDADVYDALSRILAQPVVSANLSARYQEAEALARIAVEIDGRSAAIYDQLGATLELRGLLGSETQTAYRRSIATDPLYAPAYAHLERLLRRNGKLEEAKKEYSHATSNAVDVPQLIAVAASFQSEQRSQDSVQLLMTALHLEPRNYTALVLLGRALAVGGQFSASESSLIRATRVSPSSFAAFGELGRLYLRQGKFDMAESVMTHAAGVADSFERLELASDYETVGDRYAKKGDIKMAEKAYRTSVSLDATRESIAAKIAALRR
ncbi:MAG: tetratricopeptide repeat protein [Acidobacteriota bacterium]